MCQSWHRQVGQVGFIEVADRLHFEITIHHKHCTHEVLLIGFGSQ